MIEKRKKLTQLDVMKRLTMFYIKLGAGKWRGSFADPTPQHMV
jgi:hypothetical protein